jgi:hypothetical protein
MQPAGIAPGSRVEVRKRFDDSWARGFEVVEEHDEGYRLRRLSDGSELPLVIPREDVRPEKERKHASMWWY